MQIVDERTPGQGGAAFENVLVGQSCIINGARYLKIGNHNAPAPNLLNMETMGTGHCDSATQLVADIANVSFHLLPL